MLSYHYAGRYSKQPPRRKTQENEAMKVLEYMCSLCVPYSNVLSYHYAGTPNNHRGAKCRRTKPSKFWSICVPYVFLTRMFFLTTTQVLQTTTAAQSVGDEAVTHLQAQLKKAHAARQFAQGAGMLIIFSYVNNYFICTWMSVGFRKCTPRGRARVCV